MSPLSCEETTAPSRVVRYNLYPAADINGATLPGFNSGQAIAAMERIAEETLPPGFAYEWTDLSYQQKAAGNTANYIFPLCVLFVFLALSTMSDSATLNDQQPATDEGNSDEQTSERGKDQEGVDDEQTGSP